MSNVVSETVVTPAETRHDAQQMRKLVVASVLGNALEWYDFFLYGTAAALVFGPLFFPVGGDPLQGTLLAFSGFAVGFLARPLGGIVPVTSVVVFCVGVSSGWANDADVSV